MAFSKVPEGLTCDTDGPDILCDDCNRTITPKTCFYHCRGHCEGFDLCLACILTSRALSQHYAFRPCVVDARDKRRTFIPGPEVSDFQSVIAKLEEDPLYKLPMRYYRFFHQSGLSTRDLASTEQYETSNEHIPVTANKIENDYTMYGRLMEREIRLVRLMPGPVHQPLAVVLHPVPYPWNDRHPYMALSYAWGSLEETRQIFAGQMDRCGGGSEQTVTMKRMSCTASLELALRELRDENDSHWLWIDALCINQGDIEERNQQVPLMAEIYNHAYKVAVWLGSRREIYPCGNYVHLLGCFLKKVKETFAEREDVRRGEGCGNSDEYHVLEHLVDGVGDKDDPLSTHPLTPNAQEFIRSPWFSRAWVVQEVWAARELVVLCGSTKAWVSWENVRQVSLYLSARANRFGAINSEGINKPHERKYTTLSGAKAIWRRLKKDPSAASAPIPAAELVFSDFTRWHIGYHQSLNILGQVSYSKRGRIDRLGGSVPSWSISPDMILGLHAGGMLCDRPHYHADADISLDSDLVGDAVGDRLLITRGYAMDTITGVDKCYFCPMINFEGRDASEFRPFPWRMDRDGNILLTGFEWVWKVVRRKLGVEECTGQDPCNCNRALDAMLDALTCGRWISTTGRGSMTEISIADATYRRVDRTTTYSYFASYWVASTEDPGMQQFCEQLREKLLSLVSDSKARLLAAWGMEGSYKRSMFFTKSGAMGVCCPNARPGDSIVILFGCRVPVIVRKRKKIINTEMDDSWVFVGECYLHDLMDGEAVKKRMEEDETVQTFNLC